MLHTSYIHIRLKLRIISYISGQTLHVKSLHIILNVTHHQLHIRLTVTYQLHTYKAKRYISPVTYIKSICLHTAHNTEHFTWFRSRQGTWGSRRLLKYVNNAIESQHLRRSLWSSIVIYIDNYTYCMSQVAYIKKPLFPRSINPTTWISLWEISSVSTATDSTRTRPHWSDPLYL